MHRFFYLLICTTLLMSSFYASSASLTKSVEQSLLTHVPWEDEDWPHESFYDYLSRCMCYQKEPQKFKKIRASFKILHAVQPDDFKLSPSQLDALTWKDLGLLTGERAGAPSVVDTINRTQTQLGTAWLACLVAQSRTDCAVLYKRQAIIKEFVQHKELLQNAIHLFEQLKQVEMLMLSFWLHDPLEQSAQRHYFAIGGAGGRLNDLLNSSEVALEIRTLIDTKANYVHAVTSAIATVLLPFYGIAKFTGHEFSKELEIFAQELRRGGTFTAIFAALLVRSAYAQRAFDNTIALGDGLMYGTSVSSNFAWAYDNIYLDVCLQEKLIAVATYVKIVRQLNDLIQQHPALRESLTMADALKNWCVNLDDPEFTSLLEALESDTFLPPASMLSLRGKILVAYKRMHACKHFFEKPLAAVAELDAYASLATLYQERQEQQAPCCFVHYEQQTTPYIKMHNFYNPFLPAATAIKNDLLIDGAHDRANIILTGPNAGGKSTILRSVALNMQLAQSCGIAFASAVALTPFVHIATYFNIADDLAAGNSRFKAEVVRTHDIINMVREIAPGGFSFVAVDEMFSGTSPQEGAAMAFSVAKYLGTMPHNITMIATHFPLLTRLAQETPDFENYKVSVNVDHAGVISYPFKLEQGISDQHIALDILKSEGFSSQITGDAQTLLSGSSF